METLLIEAPGAVGEARLAARHIRGLIASGVSPASIVVAHRDLVTVQPVLKEVFDEYLVPYSWPIPKLLKHSPAIAFLLKAWHLPRELFRFQPLTAMLRNQHFQPPGWDAMLPLKAEALLRGLGVPRHKEDYLATIDVLINTPFPALEDQHADIHRQKKHREQLELCRPFFVWLFARWDNRLELATPVQHAERLGQFCNDLGLIGNDDVKLLLAELTSWAGSNAKSLSSAEFELQMQSILDETVIEEPARNTPRMRVMVPESASGTECDHLLLMGLGEGSFPRFDGNPDTTIESERALWQRLLKTPAVTLTLSYPAVDAKGQVLLPGLFLNEYLSANAIPRQRQQMIVENYATGTTYSPAEMRVQYAAQQLKGPLPNLSPDVLANMKAAKVMAEARFRGGKHDVYDGRLQNTSLIAGVADKFKNKTFSPTALERYVACPFKFWMQDVLHLEAMDEPGENVEATQSGTVIHRALSRYHADPTKRKLQKELAAAVDEDIERTPSRVMKAVWQLERRRVQRYFDRYDGHWTEFKNDIAEKAGLTPVPTLLEAAVGVKDIHGNFVHDALMIEIDGITVKIGGVIDRVDVASLDDGLGYWIIDYKSGRATNYTGAALQSFEKLQLPLYALAVEGILGKNETARPLGLAYWLVSDGGAKPALPDRRGLAKWLEEPAIWQAFRVQLKQWVATLVTQLRRGDFRLAPRTEKTCDYCPYSGVCRINQMRDRHALPLALPVQA